MATSSAGVVSLTSAIQEWRSHLAPLLQQVEEMLASKVAAAKAYTADYEAKLATLVSKEKALLSGLNKSKAAALVKIAAAEKLFDDTESAAQAAFAVKKAAFEAEAKDFLLQKTARTEKHAAEKTAAEMEAEDIIAKNPELNEVQEQRIKLAAAKTEWEAANLPPAASASAGAATSQAASAGAPGRKPRKSLRKA